VNRQSHPEYSEITNQTLHNFFVNSSNVSVMNVSCHDNPMDWDLANLVPIRFFPMKPGRFFLIESWARVAMCEQVRHLSERWSCPTVGACSLRLDLAAAWWRIVTGIHFGLFVHKGKLYIRLKHQRGYFLRQNCSLITCSLWKMHI